VKQDYKELKKVKDAVVKEQARKKSKEVEEVIAKVNEAFRVAEEALEGKNDLREAVRKTEEALKSVKEAILKGQSNQQ